MAIARVRIAPVEKWCTVAQGFAASDEVAAASIVGMEVEIRTETMRKNDNCGELEWLLTRESADRIEEFETNLAPWDRGIPTYICRSMLEID